MSAPPPTIASSAGWSARSEGRRAGGRRAPPLSGPKCRRARPRPGHVDRGLALTLTGLSQKFGRQAMAVRRLGIVMYGVTGRMGANQQLARSIAAIRAEGGVLLANGDRVLPDPILVGRNEAKLAELAKAHGLSRVSSNLEACLDDRNDSVFFDAATTQ